MPGVLVVHLKRFAFSAAGGDKIAKHIEFPERLVIPTSTSLVRLLELCVVSRVVGRVHPVVDGTELLGPHAGGGEKERRSYDLFGVVEHHGHTLQSGHYTASIKRDQHWYHHHHHSSFLCVCVCVCVVRQCR
jgi:ubiquitin C-terminal hydrolase